MNFLDRTGGRKHRAAVVDSSPVTAIVLISSTIHTEEKMKFCAVLCAGILASFSVQASDAKVIGQFTQPVTLCETSENALYTLILVSAAEGGVTDEIRKSLPSQKCLYMDKEIEFIVHKTTKRVFKGMMVHEAQVSFYAAEGKLFQEDMRSKKFWAAFPVGENGKVTFEFLKMNNGKKW